MTRLRKPYLDDGDVTVYAGDCIEVMRELPEASVDAIVTDPPYGLEFMGRDWDAPWKHNGIVESVHEGTDQTHPFRDGANRTRYGFGGEASSGFQVFSEAWAREAYRVLKPGGHLLAFAGTRTYHRMAAGVEDAGFEIRDCIAWMYGSGFPKSLDVSKAIDKAAGAEREIVGTNPNCWKPKNNAILGNGKGVQSTGHDKNITAPATNAAREWHGWGTALKPAYEPVVVARKPLTGTVAQNVLTHGTGALNIDACRIAAADPFGGGAKATSGFVNGYERGEGWQAGSDLGRWPANVALDETAASVLDEQSGTAPPKEHRTAVKGGNKGALGAFAGSSPDAIGTWPADPGGGASRFFYTAKASRQDRNVGGLADNTHPTVKPTDLMRWLIRLVTPPGGIILDPFGGSGSTGLAARAENVRCILIEREDEYLKIISDRLAQLSLLA